MNNTRQGTGPVFKKCSPKVQISQTNKPKRADPAEQVKNIVTKQNLEGALTQGAAIQRSVELLKVCQYYQSKLYKLC